MQTAGSLSKLDYADCPPERRQKVYTCTECRNTFQTPILATVSAYGQTSAYYACPRCIKEVQNVQKTGRKKEERTTIFAEEPLRRTAERAAGVRCGHFLGYLSKRQKNAPFPDECLTCAKMVECMLHQP
jgi:hypothetical protein